jgi:hypothetical protein
VAAGRSQTPRWQSSLAYVWTWAPSFSNIPGTRAFRQLWASPSLFMGRPRLKSVNWPTSGVTQACLMENTCLQRKTQPRSSLDSVTTGRGVGGTGLQTRLLPSFLVSHLLPTKTCLFCLFPRNSVSHPTRSAKKKKKKKKQLFTSGCVRFQKSVKH